EPAVGAAADDGARHGGADGRVVDRVRRVGAEVVHLVAVAAQQLDEVRLEDEAGVIGSDGDAHQAPPVSSPSSPGAASAAGSAPCGELCVGAGAGGESCVGGGVDDGAGTGSRCGRSPQPTRPSATAMTSSVGMAP